MQKIYNLVAKDAEGNEYHIAKEAFVTYKKPNILVRLLMFVRRLLC